MTFQQTHLPSGWRRFSTPQLVVLLDDLDDSTDEYDDVADELAERHHENDTRINNGGVLP